MRPQQEMAVAPAVFFLVVLVDEFEVLEAEPREHLLAPGVVVLAGDVTLHDLTGHGREAAGDELGVGRFDALLVLLLDRQVQVAARSHGPVEVREHERPILGSNVFQRVNGRDGVEAGDECQLLQSDLLKLDSDAASPGLLEHAR